jgi:hypothetical protein
VVTVVIEEHDFAAEFGLESPGGMDFCHQESLWEKPARLLAEANDG